MKEVDESIIVEVLQDHNFRSISIQAQYSVIDLREETIFDFGIGEALPNEYESCREIDLICKGCEVESRVTEHQYHSQISK